jgi:hypothetical protein
LLCVQVANLDRRGEAEKQSTEKEPVITAFKGNYDLVDLKVNYKETISVVASVHGLLKKLNLELQTGKDGLYDPPAGSSVPLEPKPMSSRFKCPT